MLNISSLACTKVELWALKFCIAVNPEKFQNSAVTLKLVRQCPISNLSTLYYKVFKGTHTVYFSSSLHIINQKPMIPRTHFHCTHMGCMLFWVKFGHAFAYFVVSVY